MGRARKPLELQRGHMTVIGGAARRAEEESVTTGKSRLKRPPAWLIDDTAKKEWRRIVKELEKINLIGNLDYNNLGSYCNAFANYLKVTEELADQPYIIERETRSGTIRIRNPLIDVQKIYAEETRRFAAFCGLTIDSRLKAAATVRKKQEAGLEERFGAI